MYDIFIMDMGGNDDNVQTLMQRFPHARTVRYYDNHFDTIKRCISRCKTPYAWIISSCCDYTKFDFEYKAKPWESYQIHCWASGNQKFGDTFLIPVKEFNQQKDIELLEWYKDINWHEDGVPRLGWHELICGTEHLTQELKEFESTTPYILVNGFNDDVKIDPPLWKNRVIYSLSKSNRVSLVPKEVKGHLSTQIYDYPFISKQNSTVFDDKSLDIIYISNGEPNAEKWYQHLCTVAPHAKRISNINGRTAAYKAAAEISETPWFFAVFAKLEVVDTFDWQWQPDYFQEPKHYIFHARNPVNGLEYGHMGVIAYNRQLVLETYDPGLDFTMSKPHAVVPILSAVAHYNTTPELTWRTAFREAIKLYNDVQTTGSIESEYRLSVWLSEAEGEHSMWSLLGARDAVDFWNTCKGQKEFLMLTYEWWWLKDYYAKIYTPNAKFDNSYSQELNLQPVQLPGQLALGK